MPEISRFLGVSIRLFRDDHPPPHFHAVYNEFTAQISVRHPLFAAHLSQHCEDSLSGQGIGPPNMPDEPPFILNPAVHLTAKIAKNT